MAIGSLRSVVNESLILCFQGVAQGANPTSFGQSLRGGASKASLSDGLRTGARTYATAVQALNSVASLVNLSESTLQKLGKITDQLIDVTERSTKPGVGYQGRSKLDRQFRELGEEFQKIIEEAVVGDKQFLTTAGLTELLSMVGIPPSSASSVAKLFEEFVLSPASDQLAAEETKGKPPAPVPASAFILPGTVTTLTAQQVSANGGTAAVGIDGAVSTSHNVYRVNNTDTSSYLLKVQEQGAGTNELSSLSNINLLGVEESSGYSVIQSVDDPLGFNASNYSQLFLVDPNGSIVHQYTNNISATLTYGAADISSDRLKVAYSYSDGTATDYVYTTTAGSIGQNPALATHTLATSEGSADPISQVKISDDGSHLAFYNPDTDSIYFATTAAPGTPDAFLAAQTNNINFGFTASNQLAVTRDLSGNSIADAVTTYTFGAAAYGEAISAGFEVNNFTALEGSGSEAGYLGFSIGSGANQNDVYIYRSDGKYVTGIDGVPTDSVERISLAHNSNNSIDVGIYGVFSQVSSDSDEELYRYTGTSEVKQLSRVSRESDSLFDGVLKLTSRPDAYRLLHDLKALKQQISTNVEAVGQLRDVVEANIEVTRSAGLGLLEIADQIRSEDDAAALADKLQEYIRRNAGPALAQAENLNSIAAAALLLQDSGFDKVAGAGSSN